MMFVKRFQSLLYIAIFRKVGWHFGYRFYFYTTRALLSLSLGIFDVSIIICARRFCMGHRCLQNLSQAAIED